MELVSYLVNYWASSPGTKQPGREVNHSTPSNAEVKNECSNDLCLHPVGLHVFMAMTGTVLSAPQLVF